MQKAAIIGSGPAGLMAADVISKAGYEVTIFEKRKAAGRKLLIAGSSGLNVTNSLPMTEFIANYTGPKIFWEKLLEEFSIKDWLSFIEELGIKTFEGTSGRYFVEGMKASKLLSLWQKKLQTQGVFFRFNEEFMSFESVSEFNAVGFCLGGGSYELEEHPLRWPSLFKEKGIQFHTFIPSNVGYQVEWSKKFLEEAEGLPLKGIKLTSSKGSRMGDAMITKYGIEGTPVYFVGEKGALSMDLLPSLDKEKILKKCRLLKENFSPLRRIKKQLKLCTAAQALLYHHVSQEIQEDLEKLVHTIKKFPIHFKDAQSLDEAISSAGGIDLSELNNELMLKKHPGFFAAGEMLDWDAPTGGFLIQACVSQGYVMGEGMTKFLNSKN